MEKMCEKYWTGGGDKYLLRCEQKTKIKTKEYSKSATSKISKMVLLKSFGKGCCDARPESSKWSYL